MASKPPTIASLVRLSAKSEADFYGILSDVLVNEEDQERVVEYLTRLNLPKTMEPSDDIQVADEVTSTVTNFDDELALANGFEKFTARHLRKLKWHVSHPSIEGVTPVTLLYRSTAIMAYLRIARVVSLLGSKDVLSTHEWGTARELLNRAYRDYRMATNVLTVSWLEALMESGEAEEIRQALDHLPSVVYAQIRKLERLREEVEAARVELTVQPPGYPPVKPPRYFGGDLLDTSSWKHFWGEVNNLADGLQQQVHV
ncbi:MAG: hypothetical protein H6741_05555 [Alphaproteobacteria bacterium]|nr:hypothetical protein [Alphaproteobacteria bacterium]MCB9792173.1 hypothetical protein [Alphaproteobacteria bacterium]